MLGFNFQRGKRKKLKERERKWEGVKRKKLEGFGVEYVPVAAAENMATKDV